MVPQFVPFFILLSFLRFILRFYEFGTFFVFTVKYDEFQLHTTPQNRMVRVRIDQGNSRSSGECTSTVPIHLTLNIVLLLCLFKLELNDWFKCRRRRLVFL